MVDFRRRSDGRRMTAAESHLLAAMFEADGWLDEADLWRRATVPASASRPMLLRNSTEGFVERQLHRDRDVFRLTPRGKQFVERQAQLPVARWPWGLDLAVKRRQRQ